MPDAAAMLRHVALFAGLVAASPAWAQLCDGTTGPVSADGRVFGHLPYGDVAESELVEAPAGFSVGHRCMIRRDVLPDLERLLAAAGADPRTGGELRGLSCHRSIERQQAVFCRPRVGADGASAGAADRAISVAPPGHSEHATGYALDFAIRPRGDCPDAEACMAATPAFRWLMANAPRFGFEMSFPASNIQHVKWEPWHWRWVGARASAPGAARARFLFRVARDRFPAAPGVYEPLVIRVVQQPPAVQLAAPPNPKRKKKRRR